MTSVSVVIVSYNAREHLLRCLRSLQAHLPAATEVIVIDNASPDGSVDAVRRDFPAVRLLGSPSNVGFAAAANHAARKAAGEAILFLNPDSEIDQDVVSSPADYLRAHREAGALGLKILDPDGSLQLSVRRFPDFSVALFNRYSFLTRLFPRNPFSRRYLMSDWEHDAIAEVDWVSGACIMTTRAVLERVGYFDEGYFWGFEDVDFCQRLHRAGLGVLYYPAVAVRHEIGASARTVPVKALVARHRGMWRYYRRWLSRNPAVDALVWCGVWGRCGLQLGAVRAKRIRRSLAKSGR